MSANQSSGTGGAGALVPSGGPTGVSTSGDTVNLGDVLERILDKGVVIAGDIKINLLDIELLTIKLRLIVASVETARAMGLRWWESDPWLMGGEDEDRRSLPGRVKELERRLQERESEASRTADD